MIRIDNKVKNIYYMLCYSFYGELLNEKTEESLGSEAFDNVYNLFSILLCMLLKRQIKKGMYKEYNDFKDEIGVIKGKVNVSESINNNSFVKKRLFCEYDQYDENCLLNQVVKTTIFYLLKSNKIGNITKNSLKQLSVYYGNVDYIDIKSINWNKIKFNKNNISYKFVVDLCQMILCNLVVSDRKGDNKFKEFLDDTKVSKIFENFIKAYYRKHYPELNPTSKKLFLTDKPSSNNIPIMKTDITLEYNNKVLIIDAKFYNKILRENYFNNKCKTVNSNNLYQIITYVDSQDPYKEDKAYGMLLYAQTVNEPEFYFEDKLGGHEIIIRTLDMNSDWLNISNSLNQIAKRFEADE